MQIDDASEVKKTIEQLTKGASDMVSTLQRINAPNMKAMEKYELKTFSPKSEVFPYWGPLQPVKNYFN